MKIHPIIHSTLLMSAVLMPAGLTFAQTGAGIAQTKHNLTAGGPGTVKASGLPNACVFCHTPHAAGPLAPLWNRYDPGAYYQTYESSTLVASVGQPSGSSRLCLSCHDGTIALSQTSNARHAPGDSVHLSAHDRGFLGTDLRDDHPISFVYDASLAARKGHMAQPVLLPKTLPLDRDKQLQCTTCHDPHDDRFGHFLTMDNTESRMCQSCHVLDNWSSSPHATSSASLAASRRDKWDNIRAGTVRQAACEACHRPHGAGGRQRLLRHEAEEDNCLTCHDGSVARTNLTGQLAKLSSHPVALTTGVHSPAETAAGMTKHVECVDCHNPHRSGGTAAARAPFVKSTMKGASGMSDTGMFAADASYEYQVCYKCHAGRNTVRAPLVDRALINGDLSQLFSPANPGYHPVQTQGKNSRVPSLLQPFTTASIIYCTDCHGTDSPATARGPHGSMFRPLLVRNYATADNTMESSAAYSLCYGCHDRNSILADRSFTLHRKHVVGTRAPCSACHTAHGVSATQATPAGGAHLINFDRTIAQPSRTTRRGPLYNALSPGRGSCTLFCHNKEHVDAPYAP